VNIAVVGSGFSGIAVAHALAARGVNVTILDVGEMLDVRRASIVAKLRDLPTNAWPPEDFRLLDENPTLGRHMLPKKVHFGSEYIYANDRSFAPTISGSSKRLPYPTFAKAGYSNIWGAAVLAPDSCDTTDWPVSRSEMEPYYREAAKLIPLSGGEGTLDAAFPAYKDRLGDIDPGPQGSALLQDMRRVSARLSEHGILYGRARLAIHTEDAPGALACNGCGFCFTGCVRGSIFSTEPLLDELVKNKRATYQAGAFVESLDETDGGVRITTVDTATGARREIMFDGVFLAAGPINTTRILLRSKKLFDHVVTLKESQKFVVPILRYKADDTAIEHPSVTMASVFIEAKFKDVSDHWTHIQVIPMNALMLKGMPVPGIRSKAGQLFGKPLLRRLMAAWCGMHSDQSSSVELRLLVPDASGRSTLEIDVRRSESARAAARRVARNLFREGLSFNSVFMYPAIQFSEPGSGTHCGSSFPMRERPNDLLDTDTLGRPFGWSRVFAVDASVLPSIPGTTLAFSAMANACRIGALAPLEELASTT